MSYAKARQALDKAWALVGPAADNYVKVNGLPDYKVEAAKIMMDLAELELQLAIAQGERPSLPKIPEDVPLLWD